MRERKKTVGMSIGYTAAFLIAIIIVSGVIVHMMRRRKEQNPQQNQELPLEKPTPTPAGRTPFDIAKVLDSGHLDLENEGVADDNQVYRQRRSTAVPLKRPFQEADESISLEANQKNLNAYDNIMFGDMPLE